MHALSDFPFPENRSSKAAKIVPLIASQFSQLSITCLLLRAVPIVSPLFSTWVASGVTYWQWNYTLSNNTSASGCCTLGLSTSGLSCSPASIVNQIWTIIDSQSVNTWGEVDSITAAMHLDECSIPLVIFRYPTLKTAKSLIRVSPQPWRSSPKETCSPSQYSERLPLYFCVLAFPT